MSKANDEERLSSDGEWVEDEWVVMEDDIHAKWVRTLVFIHFDGYPFFRLFCCESPFAGGLGLFGRWIMSFQALC